MVDFSNMTAEQFNALVQSKVEEQLSSREEAEARREAEQALTEARETFQALKASIETKDAKLREYEEALASLDAAEPSAAEVAANGRVVELENELEEYKRRVEVAEAALETLAREEIAANRMAELEEAGVSLEDRAAEVQYSKVRNLTDEEFVAYKDELLALKSKYASTSDEATEEAETAELSSEEISLIAQSLGCDPADSKCISLVQEVAQKMSEISVRYRKGQKNQEVKADVNSDVAAAVDEMPNKETASVFSLGEAITRSLDQNLQANLSLKEELTQAWADYYAEKRGPNRND